MDNNSSTVGRERCVRIIGLVAIVIYLCLVRLLRYRRASKTQSKFTHARALSTMTYTEAFEIMRGLQELEFPSSFRKALALALIKTAGIPTISKLLLATGQLSKRNAPKRASDTEVLMTEVQNSSPESLRHLQAIARVNFLHARYRKEGKILNEDMLHTLGDAMAEMFRVVDTHEWRKLTTVERCAIGLFHKNFGEALEIDFAVLPSSAQGWESGLHFSQELEDWAEQYQAQAARPTHSTRTLTERFLSVALYNTPKIFQPYMRQKLSQELGDVMRESMGLPRPSALSRWAGAALQFVRKAFLRYLCLPRPEFLAVKHLADQPDPRTGLYDWHHYMAEPWYVQPSLSQRWGPRGIFIRLFGSGIIPSQDSKYRSDGYDLRIIGPTVQEGQGLLEMDRMIEVWKAQGRGGCPFHSPHPTKE